MRLTETPSGLTIPDMSNYTSVMTVEDAVNWRDNLGVKKVWIQAIYPPAGYPPGQTRQQIELFLGIGGVKVGIYFYHWYEDYAGALDARIDLVRPYFGQLDDWVNDVEDVSTGKGWTVQQKMDSINAANDNLGQIPTAVNKRRGYSGLWYLNGYLDSRVDFFDEWWLSQFDNIRDASVIRVLPGMGPVIAKQYVGTSVFGLYNRPHMLPQDYPDHGGRLLSAEEWAVVKRGVNMPQNVNQATALRQARRGHYRLAKVGGLDLSVPSSDEAQRLVGDEPQDPCVDVSNDRNGLVSGLGYLGLDAMEQSGILKSTSRYAKAYVNAVRAVCNQHSINHA